MTDIPRRAVSRTARLASLPLGVAGRATLGLGKRLGGRSADEVTEELQRRTAEQLFAVLGQLKGGAMKFGQALSVFEAAFPEEMAAPYREALTKLQEGAPPMPAQTVHQVLARAARPGLAAPVRRLRRAAGRRREHRPGAPGDLGGRAAGRGQGAVPGGRAGAAGGPDPAVPVRPDVRGALARAGRQAAAGRAAGADRRGAGLQPGGGRAARLRLGVRRTIRRCWCRGWSPARRRCWSASGSTASRWPGSSPTGDRAQRDRAGYLLALLHFSAPQRAGLLHADPHPGNFRLLPDGRLGVIDFGAVARLPGGLPEPIGRLVRLALEGDAEAVLAGLRQEGFVRPDLEVDADRVLRLPAADAGAAGPGHVPVHPGVDARGRPPGSPTRATRRPRSAASSTCPRRTC